MFAVINNIASGEVVAATAGKRIRVMGYSLSSTGTTQLAWKSAATAISGPMGVVNGSNISPAPAEREGLFETAAGEALNLDNSAGVQVGGHLHYQLIG